MKKFLVIVMGIGILTSCGDDDIDTLGGIAIPPRLLSEVAPEDDQEIQEFLQTHFYNYEDFQDPIAPDFDFKIVIDTIEGDNADKTPLIDQVEVTEIGISAFEFGLSDGEEDIIHRLYYLNAREGVGGDPSVADSVFVRYTGRLLDGRVFDGSNTGTWFDLAQIQAPAPVQAARGFSEGVSFFNAGIIPGPDQQPNDGTFIAEGFGVGVVFMPSGLGFFNSGTGIIEAYTPLIFEVDVLTWNFADHDNDGIPSIEEDLNGNGYLYDDNTNEAGEREIQFAPLIADFQDIDDDGDGVLTRTEISDADGNIIFPYPDSNNDDIPDYLDPDIQRDPNE
ncbi:MAG: hypothetical protein AAF039_12095 [Bacteroidota bacterium]